MKASNVVERVVGWLGWIFVVVPPILLLASIARDLARLDISNATLAVVAIATISVAVGAQLLVQSKVMADSRESRSLFYLDAFVTALDEAKKLLADDNNERAAWIRAGRVLMHAEEFSHNITESAHQKILEIHKLNNRSFFSDAIEKPAEFFYGVDGWRTKSLEEVAKESSAPVDRENPAHRLSEKSLRAVWLAAQWPPDYDDPAELRFSKTELGKLIVLNLGLSDYLEHTDEYVSASGKLHPWKENEKKNRARVATHNNQ